MLSLNPHRNETKTSQSSIHLPLQIVCLLFLAFDSLRFVDINFNGNSWVSVLFIFWQISARRNRFLASALFTNKSGVTQQCRLPTGYSQVLIQYRLINAIGTGERISLSKLAITHLERTARPIRVAVDISIWLFQIQAGRGGTNPELRTLFYRLLKVLALPVHPLFVYDGREKPPFKRGKAVSGRSYGSAPIIRLSKTLVDLFKFPRHDAPGEAEAECARLQRAGVVDAVMSNDVDALMFGSTFAVMNYSKENGSGTSAATHVTRYQMQDLASPSRVELDRAGMILFAMLSGGDYLPSGVPKCGSKLAAEIARAGFGQDLLEILESDPSELDMKLDEWRERLQYELEENESGYFQTKHKAVRIPETFPDRTVLSYYAKPVVSTESEIEFLRGRLTNAWDKEVDVLEIRRFAAQTFDWNYRSGARKVIRLLAEPLVFQRLRLGRQLSAFPVGMSLASDSGAAMLSKVYKSRTSFSTDGLPEVQVDMVPIDVVGLDLMAEEPNPPLPSTPLASQENVELGEDEDDPEVPAELAPQSPTKKRTTRRYDPYSTEKIWVFEAIAEIGIPDVVRKWKKEQTDRASAVKKPSNRRSGPRRKGPIDPEMKHGSILKYGTLTKERSEISQFKPAVSTPPKSSPSMFYSFQESSNGSMSTHSPRHMGTERYRQPQVFDDLDDMFSSFSSLPPSKNIKRHTLLSRNRIGSTSMAVGTGNMAVEALGASIEDLSLDCPSPPAYPRGLRMSYSNTSYKSPVQRPDTKQLSISPPGASGRKLSRELEDKSQVSHRYQRLEDSLASLTLSDPESKVFTSQSTVASTENRFSRKIIKSPGTLPPPTKPGTTGPFQLHEDTQQPPSNNLQPVKSESPHPPSAQLPKEISTPLPSKKSEASKPIPGPKRGSKKPEIGKADQPQPQSSSAHHISMRNDTLEAEIDSETELASVDTTHSSSRQTEEHTISPTRQKNKQKRTRRISIIDLT